MPSLEERREVAARLRENADSGLYDERNAAALIGMVLFATNATVEDTTEDIMRCLADLIEPEPERAIKLTCGGLCPDCRKLIGEGESYCAYCGARVIGGQPRDTR